MTKGRTAAILLLFVFLFPLVLTACGGGEATVSPSAAPTAPVTPSPTPTPTPEPTPTPDPVQVLLEELTVEQKVGQLLVAGFEGFQVGEDAVQAVQDYQVGGLILYARNVESAEQLAGLTNTLKALNGEHIPLFLSMDKEGGQVSRMPPEVGELPPALTFGEPENEELRLNACYCLGGVLAQRCKAFGINLNYTPVLDVWSNPDNTVIGNRSFGTDATRVAAAAPQTAYGMMDAGVIPVVKHFPGHGDTAVDSHLGLPVVDKTLEELEALELLPFREAVSTERYYGTYEAGKGSVPAVMVGHILMTAFDTERPATLSPAVVTGLLREKLGFDGLICTDDLTMAAIADTYGMGEAAVLALEAGCDLLLVCHGAGNLTAAREGLLAAVESGRISQERLDESVYRILALKLEYSLTNDPVPQPDVAALQQAAERLLELLP